MYLKKISVAFRNESNYDHHFYHKRAEESKKQCTCLGENTGNYITFTAPVEKEITRIDKNGEEVTKNKSYILQFIDSPRFVPSSLSNLLNNLSERIHRIKCQYSHIDKTSETCGIIDEVCNCFLEYTELEDDLIEYKCLRCNSNYQQKCDEKLKEQYFNTYKFSNHNNNKFYLLLQEGVFPHEYMNDSKQFNEKSLPEKEAFYGPLSREDITDTDYAHVKRVCKDFEINILGEYHDLYVQTIYYC